MKNDITVLEAKKTILLFRKKESEIKIVDLSEIEIGDSISSFPGNPEFQEIAWSFSKFINSEYIGFKEDQHIFKLFSDNNRKHIVGSSSDIEKQRKEYQIFESKEGKLTEELISKIKIYLSKSHKGK